MNEPLVTVFITVYNGEKYISKSLESILNQTYSNLEILIIDDGSNDKTASIIRKYQDKRISLLINKKNEGIPHNRIKGINLSKGKYLAIMDADDIATIDRLKVQVEYMENNFNIIAAASYYKAIGKKFNNRVYKCQLSPEELKIDFLFENPILNSSSIIRLDTIRQLNINYNPNYFVVQDYDFWVQVSKIGEIAIIPKVLVKYRYGHNNITKLSSRNKTIQRNLIISNIHNDLLDYYQFKLTSSEKKVFNDFFQEFNPRIEDKLITNFSAVLSKLIDTNAKLEIFNKKIFNKILESSIQDVFKRGIAINLFKSIYYWSRISKKNILIIVAKSSYFRMIKIIKNLLMKQTD